MSNPVSLTIAPEIVEGVIQSQIQAAIVAQFSKSPDILDRIVRSVIERKVDDKGVVNSYSSYNKYSLLDILTEQTLKGEVEGALKQWVKTHQPEIMKAVTKALDAQKGAMVKQFVKAANDALTASFYVSAKIEMEPKKN